MIIGISGCIGAGKDTVASCIIDEWPGSWVHVDMAGSLKRGLNAMFGFTDDNWKDRCWKENNIKELGMSPRELIQTLGTEWGRGMVGISTWIDIVFKDIDKDVNTVITGVRFTNEAKAIKDRGGILMHLDNNFVGSPLTDHESESNYVSLKAGADVVISTMQPLDDVMNDISELLCIPKSRLTQQG